MKYTLVLFLVLGAFAAKAQKYALLDQQFIHPVTYANVVTSADKFNHLFPVEKKMLPEFIKVLKEINVRLMSKKSSGNIRQYEIGCIKFTGNLISVGGGPRIDYVITSTCSDVRISMHLCTAQQTNSNNAYFVKTWIQYIENNVK
ncbi:MAG: hypothetical protein ABIY62_04425 [Ginsengibacter sp.]